ncbi:F-box/LRR-repeat protein 2 isoform X5 [Vulpes lagopus]|uniref:F-box/LRR-repeat protein 2 isoform X5 n=1 Tax=Vulpes lagopus TaxID=494514 RepID=UPI001BCA5BAE|nr:F-box/LRR-repeat protein 2 isoform X5 [Vulpes lagopus]
MVFSNNDEGLINKKLPKELLLRMLFSLLLNFTWSNPECTKYVHSIGLDSFCNVLPEVELLIKEREHFTAYDKTIAFQRIFSFLDIVTLCRCAQISKAWNILALDGSNWQRIDLFNFQTDVEGRVVENISKRCGGFLRKLSLRGCIGVGDSSLKTFAQNCRNIEHLNLNGCTKITDSTCYSLSRFCSKLKHLDLTSCVSITNSSLKGISEGCRNLEYLNLSWCDQITKDGIEALVRGCRGLKALLLRGCTQLEDEALKHIQNYCHELVSLNLQSCSSLSHCELITDDGILHLSNSTCGHERLRVLELDNCLLITDVALEHLENCRGLERLELYDCQQVTRAGIKRMRAQLPHVKVHAYFAPVTPPTAVGGSGQRLCRCCVIL